MAQKKQEAFQRQTAAEFCRVSRGVHRVDFRLSSVGAGQPFLGLGPCKVSTRLDSSKQAQGFRVRISKAKP